jgi:hypothetical protein
MFWRNRYGQVSSVPSWRAPMSERLEILMQACAVQVRTTEHHTGTGFFVAPGRVATAAFRPGREGALILLGAATT